MRDHDEAAGIRRQEAFEPERCRQVQIIRRFVEKQDIGISEELIIEFRLNSQPFGVPARPITINQRMVANYYDAKRLRHALSVTLHRHEATFGVLETDVSHRVHPAAVRLR